MVDPLLTFDDVLGGATGVGLRALAPKSNRFARASRGECAPSLAPSSGLSRTFKLSDFNDTSCDV
jgi:hypothetical protein